MAFLNLRFWRRPAWCALLLGASVLFASAQNIATAYKIRAVYLVKFLQFVEWPEDAFPSADSPLVIGVLGNDPFGRVLDEAVEGESVRKHSVVIRRYRQISQVDGAQVLFVAESERRSVAPILAALKGRSILTVSDLDDFSIEGGIVRFTMENNKVRFRINVDAAKDAKLNISSKLLQLAEVVHSRPAP